ncbi:hypothetical protein DSO57_1005970 [Entomophthora muscae]|uniref:Uncharacterized protein n=1 Tax=Entomophthora muscae TaxID=34485 RepID=A0ACC2TWE0_9FUNG|nr:hypothetical protein DSO57_1005970 [Entomophthora muscae]
MIKTFPLKDPFSLFNRRANPNNIPIITWVTANGVLQKFFQEQGPPNDEKFHASKKEINIPHPSPANDESATLDDTEDFQALLCNQQTVTCRQREGSHHHCADIHCHQVYVHHQCADICCHQADTHCHYAEAHRNQDITHRQSAGTSATKQTSSATVRAPITTKQIHAATKLLPVVNMQAPAATAQAPVATKQIHTTTTKLLPAVNTQTLAAIEQMPTATERRPPLLTAPPASHPQTRHP